jgi:hypothetical protein
MRTIKALSVFMILGSTTVAWSKAKAPQGAFIPAFDGASPGIKGSNKAPEYINSEVHRISPDGKYIVRLINGEGDVSRLQVYRYVKTKTKTPSFRPQDVVSKNYDEVHGVAWVPNHSHWLVISSGNDVAPPRITLWMGNSKRVLKRELKHEISSPYVSEMFDLRSVSVDGRFIIYDRSLYGMNGEYKLIKNLKLSLPYS